MLLHPSPEILKGRQVRGVGGAYQEKASWDIVADALNVFLGLLSWSTVMV